MHCDDTAEQKGRTGELWPAAMVYLEGLMGDLGIMEKNMETAIGFRIYIGVI